MAKNSFVASTSAGYVRLAATTITYVQSIDMATRFNSIREAFQELDAIQPDFRCVVSEICDEPTPVVQKAA